MALSIFVDGGSRGNPGPAGGGVVIRDESGARLHEAGYFFGRQTNNAAEYRALLAGLQRSGKMSPQPLIIYSDSQLLVRQMTGEYQVKNPALGELFHQAQLLLLRVSGWSFRHIPREENSRADELANLAMDKQRDVIVFDVDKSGGAQASGGGAGETVGNGGGDLFAEAGDSSAANSSATGVAEVTAARGVPAGRVQVSMSRAPKPGKCPAGDWMPGPLSVGTVVPQGVCVHAAHAMLPTLLGIVNSDPQEFASIPTLTVRCSRPECGAMFQLNPVTGGNGKH